MFKTGMTGLIRTLGPLPGSLLKGAKAGIACDWTRPEDFVYSYQPIMDEWYSSYVFEDVGGVPTQVGERMYQEILLIGNVYRINFTVSGRTKGTIVAEAGTNQGAVRDEDGTYTDTLVCIGAKLSFYKTADFDGEMTVVSVENLSVTEALPLKTVGSWQGSRFVQPAAANMPYYEPGKDGSPGALRFDGINDFMQHTGDQQKLHTPSGFTAAFVIEPEITAATGQRVILDQTNNNVANAGIQVVYDAANQQITTRVSNGSEWTVSGSTWLSRGIPHIVDARWDEASGLDLVVDDHSVEVVGGSGSLADTVALELGRRQGGDYFSGRVSDMVVREGRVPEKDLERWRGKMRGKHPSQSVVVLTCEQQEAKLWFMLMPGERMWVNWGDGQFDEYATVGWINPSHVYDAPGKRDMSFEFVPGTLTHFHVDNIKLSGRLPDMRRQPNLTQFYIYKGQNITGQIPDFACNPNISEVNLALNNLTGQIPDLEHLNIAKYYVYSNKLTGSIPRLNAGIGYFGCNHNLLTGSIPDLALNTNLLDFACHNNNLTGPIPQLTNNTKLIWFNCHNNNLTGPIPQLTNITNLDVFACHNNNLTGPIPQLTNNTKLIYFACHNNNLTGPIPQLTNNTKLVEFACGANMLDGYTPSTISTTLINFRAENNLLPQTAIDQIIADFHDNLNNRPTAGTLSLGGTGNAAPSSAAAALAQDIRDHGWTVTHN